MGVSHREIISIVQLIVYFPILFASGFVVFRHGLRRDLGWIYLSIFSIARIVGAILFIVVESQSHPSTGLIIAAFVVQSAALTPLMLATVGFLGIVSQGADLAVNQYPVNKILHLPLLVGLILAIIAGTDSSDPTKASEVISFKKASAILFLVVYIGLVLLHLYFWSEKNKLQLRRRTLLLGISFALPPLGARLAFSIGGAFSSSTSSFSTISGSVVLYGLLAVLPEFLVVLDYTIIGLILPLDQDLKEAGLEKQDQNKWRPNILGRFNEGGYSVRPPPSRVQNGGDGYYANANGQHRYPPQ